MPNIPRSVPGTSIASRQIHASASVPATAKPSDAARPSTTTQGSDPWPTMKRDVLSCFATLGAAAGLACGGAPVLGVSLALGGAFSALLKWGPTNAATREAAFSELVAELHAAGVAQADIEKLDNVGRNSATQVALFHAIFPELSTQALASWLCDLERIDEYRLLDFGRIVIALRGAMNRLPGRHPDEVLRSLPVGRWAIEAEQERKQQFDPSQVGAEKPLAMAARDVLTRLYGDFRPTPVDPVPVRAAKAETASVRHHDAGAWLANHESRALDAGRAEMALGEWQANAAQSALRRQREALAGQKHNLKFGTQSRQADRRIRALELQEALLDEPNESKRDGLRQDLTEVRKDIALWNLPKRERTTHHKQRRGEVSGFSPPALSEPRRTVPLLLMDACDGDNGNGFDADPTLAMTTSAAPRHGGPLQSLLRLSGNAGRSIGAFVSSMFAPTSPGHPSADTREGTPLADFSDGKFMVAPADIEAGAIHVVTGSQRRIAGWAATGTGVGIVGGVIYTGYEWLRGWGSQDTSSAQGDAQPPGPALTSSQQSLIDKLAGGVHADGSGTWGSTFDAIAAMTSGVSDAHSPGVVAKVTELLRDDFHDIASIFTDDFGSLGDLGAQDDFREVGAPEPDRQRFRRSVDTSGTARRFERLRDETSDTLAAKHSVIEIIDTVIQFQHLMSTNDETLLFGALQRRWHSDPDLDWLARAPESEQKLWLHYVQKARDRFDDFAKAINDAQPLDGIYAAFAQAGLEGSPPSWTLTYSVPIPGLSQPVTARRRLVEACLTGDAGRDPQRYEGLLVGQPVPDEQTRRMRNLLRSPACRTTSQERLNAMESNIPALATRLAAYLEAELHRDVLDAKLKGHLTGGRDVWIRGLDVIRKALADSPDVDMGELRLAPPGMSEVPLSPWLVFADTTRKDTDPNGCVVLYRPGEKDWSIFNSRQALYQYLDLTRMRLALAGELTSATTNTTGIDVQPLLPQVALESVSSRDRQALRKFLDTQVENSVNWKPEYFRFVPYTGARLPERLEAWAQRQLDLHMTQLGPLSSTAGLSSQLTDAFALAQRLQAYEDEHFPPLREFTRRRESDKLTRGLRSDALPDLGPIDANTVFIDFNSRNMTVTDWVLEGYRAHGDNPFASTNNFQLDARITAGNADVAARLNTAGYKESLERNLRSTYAGDAYIEHLRAWLNSDDGQAQTFRNLTQAVIRSQLQLTLSRTVASGQIDPTDAAWMRALIDGLPSRVATGDTFVSELLVGDRRIPGVLVLTQRKRRSGDVIAQDPLRKDFVWLPDGPYGSEFLLREDYRKVMHKAPYDDDLRERVLKEDQGVIEADLRNGKGVEASRVKTRPLSDFASFSNRRLLDRIVDVEASTTSRGEVIWGEVIKAARFAAMPICAGATGGLGVALCGLSTAVLAGVDVTSALRHVRDGDLDGALLDVAFLWADTFEIGAGLRVMDPRRLLAWARKTHFTNVAEATEVLSKVRGERSAFDGAGHLRDALMHYGVDVGHASPTPIRTGSVNGGVRYEREGRDYIRDGGRTFEVFSDDAWASVRVRDPQRPNGPGVPVTFRNGRWQWDDGGLLGGAPSPAKRARIVHPSNYLTDLGMSERDAGIFLRAFVFPPGVEDVRRMELVQAMHSMGKIPEWAHRYVRASERGQVFGMTGTTPIDVLGRAAVTVDVSKLQRYRDKFDFPNPAMWHWFDQDVTSHSRPMWAARYAKTRNDVFSPEEVLAAKGVFHDSEAAHRYLSSFGALDDSRRIALADDRMVGGRTPEWAYPYLRINDAWPLLSGEGLSAERILVAAGAFANDQDVRDYLSKFDFSSFQVNGDAREWLAQRRLQLGSTPLEFSQYLHTPINTGKSASKMLVEARIFPTQRAADEYLAHFKLDNRIFGKRSTDELKQIALARILEGAPPSWAFRMVEPEAVLRLYGPNRIPHQIESLSIASAASGQLALPRVMPNLKTLRIIGDIGITLPVDMPKLESLLIKGGRTSPELRLPAMERINVMVIDGTNANSVHIPDGCNELRTLSIYENSALRSVVVESTTDGATGRGLPSIAMVRIENNRRLQQIELPRELPSLAYIYLDGNDLTRLPFSSEHRLVNLRELNVRRNRIATLAALPHAPELQALNLNANQFSNIPPSVESWRSVSREGNQLAPRLNVHLEDNPIPAERIALWQQRPAANDGARVYFSMGNPFSDLPRRPLADAVSDWFPPRTQDAHRRAWEAFAGEDNAQDFSSFLERLRRTVNYESLSFRSRVQTWLARLETDTALRDKTLPVSLHSTTSCEDRVTYTYGQMKQTQLATDVASGVYDEDAALLESTMRGLFRLEVLEQIAREKFRSMPGGDEIEVYLAYQVKLRGPLALPTDAAEMRYYGISGVRDADLQSAKERVLREEGERFPAYLANAEPIQEALKRRWPQEFEAAQEKLTDVTADHEVFEQRVKEHLKGDGLENDPDAVRDAGPSVMRTLTLEAYGPLVDRLLGNA